MARALLLESFAPDGLPRPRAVAAATAPAPIDRASPAFLEGRADGFAEGHAAARAELEAKLRAAEARAGKADADLARIRAETDAARRALTTARAEAASRLSEDGARLIGAACAKLLPDLAKRGFAHEAAAEVRAWLARAAGVEAGPRLRLVVAPSAREAVAALLADAPTVEIVVDTALAEASARVEWVDGLGEIDLAALAARLRRAMARHFTRLGLPNDPTLEAAPERRAPKRPRRPRAATPETLPETVNPELLETGDAS